MDISSYRNLDPQRKFDRLKSRWQRRRFLRRSRRYLASFLERLGIKSLPRMIVGVLAGLLFAFSFLVAIFSLGLPNPARMIIHSPTESTKVLDRNGEVLYDIFEQKKRTTISFEEMPDYIKWATIATEDKDFYKHGGFDIRGMMRGLFLQPLLGRGVQGGSTITQQFVKNALLTPRRSLVRKVRELILSIELERIYTKDKILELYLNEIPYGSNAYGIEAAAQTYFGKHASQLTLGEAAALAGMPRAPTYYSPYGQDPNRVLKRKDFVLKRMWEEGYITKAEYEENKGGKVDFKPKRESIRAPHFVLYVKELLADKYGERVLETGGLKITTTLDVTLQKYAEEAIEKRAEFNEKHYKAKNEALVAINPQTGEILAMVGSRDYFDLENDGNVNVTTRLNQPGSAFKPIVYATAFKKNYNPATMLMDVRTDFGNGYRPQNYDGLERGPISARQALAQSINIPSVKALAYAGVYDSVKTARDMGISTLTDPDRYGLSLVLGGGDVTLLDLTSAYGVFAFGGKRVPPVAVLKVEDSKGRVLEQYDAPKPRKALDPQVAYLINNILSDDAARAPAFGAGGYLTLGDRPVAAKTGTTNEYRDGWTIGYTPSLAAGVWAGNNDNTSMTAAGYSVAAPIWNNFMRRALSGKSVENFEKPKGIRHLEVDSLSGKLPSDATPSTKSEIFASWNAPTQKDDIHKKVRVVSFAPDLLAPSGFPANLTEEKIFVELHSERPENPNWENPVIAWAKAHGYNNIPTQTYKGGASASSGGISIISPQSGDKVNGAFTVQVRTGTELSKVEIYYDDILQGNKSESPWEFKINPLLDGQVHNIEVRGYSAGKLQGKATVFVVANQGDTLMTVQVLSGENLPARIKANLTAKGREYSLSQVRCFIDGRVRANQPGAGEDYLFEIADLASGEHSGRVIFVTAANQVYKTDEFSFRIL